MSLPLPWVDRIFEKLTLTYGNAFLNRWREIDLNAVKSDWMHELAGFENAPEAIKYGLQHLPEKPPTVLEFRSICRLAPEVELPRLSEPQADPVLVRQNLDKWGELKKTLVNAPKDCREWARVLIRRHESGEKLTPTQLQMARNALGNQ
jgi:hypothetical protein